MTREGDPAAIAKSYLEAMEARNFDRARQYLAEEFEMIFPGGRRPARIEEIAANSGRRYHQIAKRFEGCDVAERGERTVVYGCGVLYGQWPDGTPFNDIRFVDRFELKDDKIARQWVWNDAGEARLKGIDKAAE
jgi:hypothetical protein